MIAWGPATVARGIPANLGVIVAPAVEDDRPRLAAYFTKLVDGDKAAIQWTHAFVAADMVKKVVISAEQGIALINTSFMEDLPLFQSKIMAAGAGTSAWAGMVDTRINLFTETRTIQEIRPSFYAIQQLQRHIAGYESVERVKTVDRRIRLYKFGRRQSPVWIAWLETERAILPGDPVPAAVCSLKTESKAVKIEPMIDSQGQTKPDRETVQTKQGLAEVSLTPRPVFILVDP